MKKTSTLTQHNPSFWAFFYAGSFALSAVFFTYLFFYRDLQKGYDSLQSRYVASAPVYQPPTIKLPDINLEEIITAPALKPDQPTTTVPDNIPAEIPNDAKEAQKVFIAYELGDENLASKLAANFLADRPESAFRNRVRLVGAHIRNKRGDTQGALDYLKTILSDSGISNEDFTDSVLLMGSIARETKQYEGYIQTYLEQAFFRASEPARSKMAFYLGYLLLNKKDYASAARYFNNALGEEGALGRAELYMAEGKRPEAINALADFLSLYPSSYNYEFAKTTFLKESKTQAASLAARGYTDAAISTFQKVATRFLGSKEGDEALLGMADLYEQKLDAANNKKTLEKILDNDEPTYDADALFRLGKLAFAQNQYPQALGYFKVITEKFPTSPYIKETMEWQRLILDTLRE
ncbi:MAG: tetratricopeptide repeat protein [Brevinema sp.]